MSNEIRFAVGSRDDLRSSVWRLWANRNRDDLYLGARTLAPLTKISFHQSGICRLADVSTAPRRPMTAWASPTKSIAGITPIFAILVPPIQIEGRFRDLLPPKEKPTVFVSPSDFETKVIFRILLASKTCQENDIRNTADKTIFFHGRVHTKNKVAWLISYYDSFHMEEYRIVMNKVRDLKINLTPTAKKSDVKFATMQAYDVSDGSPRVTDLPLGIGNLHLPVGGTK